MDFRQAFFLGLFCYLACLSKSHAIAPISCESYFEWQDSENREKQALRAIGYMLPKENTKEIFKDDYQRFVGLLKEKNPDGEKIFGFFSDLMGEASLEKHQNRDPKLPYDIRSRFIVHFAFANLIYERLGFLQVDIENFMPEVEPALLTNLIVLATILKEQFFPKEYSLYNVLNFLKVTFDLPQEILTFYSLYIELEHDSYHKLQFPDLNETPKIQLYYFILLSGHSHENRIDIFEINFDENKAFVSFKSYLPLPFELTQFFRGKQNVKTKVPKNLATGLVENSFSLDLPQSLINKSEARRQLLLKSSDEAADSKETPYLQEQVFHGYGGESPEQKTLSGVATLALDNVEAEISAHLGYITISRRAFRRYKFSNDSVSRREHFKDLTGLFFLEGDNIDYFKGQKNLTLVQITLNESLATDDLLITSTETEEASTEEHRVLFFPLEGGSTIPLTKAQDETFE